MTLEELKNKCIENGFQYAYGNFKEIVEPPHLIAVIGGSSNVFADDIVFKKKNRVQLDYTYIDKNIEEEAKIEDKILQEIAWEKTEEAYFPDEKVWQVSYFFEI